MCAGSMGYGNQNKMVMAYHPFCQEHRSYNSRISHQAQLTTCSVAHVVLAGSVCRQYCHKSSRRCNQDEDASFGRL